MCLCYHVNIRICLLGSILKVCKQCVEEIYVNEKTTGEEVVLTKWKLCWKCRNHQCACQLFNIWHGVPLVLQLWWSPSLYRVCFGGSKTPKHHYMPIVSMVVLPQQSEGTKIWGMWPWAVLAYLFSGTFIDLYCCSLFYLQCGEI